jgi:vacuolar-type H+-ATPase subunit E/Vma4
METQDQSLSIFLECINQSARKAIDSILDQADEYEEKALEKAKKEASQKSWEYIKYESEKLKSQTNRRISETNIAMKKQLMEQRNQIADAVFSKVAEKLTAFTQTDGYKDFLLKSVQRAAGFYKDLSFTVLVKEADLCHSEFLKETIKTLSTVESDKSIVIGGCKAKSPDSNAELDDTLDSRLESKKSWFYENSQLILK